MRKTLLATTAILLAAATVNAQPRKGDWITGVRLFPLGVKGGYFLSDRLTVGASVMGSSHHVFKSQNTYVNANVGPSVRYYFAKQGGMQPAKFYAFADAEVLYTLSWTNSTPLKKDQYSDNLRAGLAPGLIYLINDRVSGEAAFRVNYVALNNPADNNLSTTFEIGFNVLLKGRKKKASDMSEMRGS